MPKGNRHSAKFKFKVALEAAKGTKTLNELASEYGLHPSQISEWKGLWLSEGVSIFYTTTAQEQREQSSLYTEFYEQSHRTYLNYQLWMGHPLITLQPVQCVSTDSGRS